VNPAQFGPAEDFKKYPRPFARDAALCRAAGVDLLLAPRPESMYAADHDAWVTVPRTAAPLCGAFRPGHFRGVATVVAQLFNLAQPTRAYFGAKDYQQTKNKIKTSHNVRGFYLANLARDVCHTNLSRIVILCRIISLIVVTILVLIHIHELLRRTIVVRTVIIVTIVTWITSVTTSIVTVLIITVTIV
jgi:hypothetical protein